MPFSLEELASKINKRAVQMASAGYDPQSIAELIHLDTVDVAERRSALSPYEALRARTVIADHLDLPQVAGPLGPWFGTVGDPKLRLRPRDIAQFSPTKVLRRWRSAIEKLRRINPNIIGFCVVELQLCRLLERPFPGQPRYFFEPHMHFVLYGVTKQQVRAAFRMRSNPRIVVRKRPVKVQAVYDLDRLLGYLTKVRPDFRRQYLETDGSTGWGRNHDHFPDRHIRKWFDAMGRFQMSDLLTATGISLKIVGVAGVAELATSSMRNSR